MATPDYLCFLLEPYPDKLVWLLVALVAIPTAEKNTSGNMPPVRQLFFLAEVACLGLVANEPLFAV